jgi:hypothetical protein
MVAPLEIRPTIEIKNKQKNSSTTAACIQAACQALAVTKHTPACHARGLESIRTQPLLHWQQKHHHMNRRNACSS